MRLRNLGLLENNFTDDAPGELPRLAAIEDESSDVEHRVRSYLEVNCAPCHRPGIHYAGFDARLTTPLAMTNLLEGEAFHARERDLLQLIVAPGSHGQSLLLNRMQSSAIDWRMPPLGRNQVDEQAIALMKKWIASLAKKSETAAQSTKETSAR